MSPRHPSARLVAASAALFCLAGTLTGCTGGAEPEQPTPANPFTTLSPVEQQQVRGAVSRLQTRAADIANLVESTDVWPTTLDEFDGLTQRAGVDFTTLDFEVTAFAGGETGYRFCVADVDNNWVKIERSETTTTSTSIDPDAPADCSL